VGQLEFSDVVQGYMHRART